MAVSNPHKDYNATRVFTQPGPIADKAVCASFRPELVGNRPQVGVSCCPPRPLPVKDGEGQKLAQRKRPPLAPPLPLMKNGGEREK